VDSSSYERRELGGHYGSPAPPARGAALKGPLLLVVLDGWGHREAAESNAILARAPYFHELLAATRTPSWTPAAGRWAFL